MHAFLQGSIDLPDSLDTLHIYPDKSIGIEEVRQIQTFLARKPIQSPHSTVVIHDAHLLTQPAQNALLKTLEEPPGQAHIYLLTSQPDLLLPTVLSRVQINSQFTIHNLQTKDLKKTKELIDKLTQSRVGERLKILDELSLTRETALELVNDVENLLHSHITSPLIPLLAAGQPFSGEGNGKGEVGALHELLVQTRTYLKANCSVKLSMDNFVIGLQSLPPRSTPL